MMPNRVFRRVSVKSILAVCLMLGCAASAPATYAQGSEATVSGKFEAKGPTQPVKLERSQLKGAVQVSFDLLPTSMSFDLPWNYCMVAENGIKLSYFAAETYDPRDFDGTGGAASFEPGMDREGRYVRAWIEQQSDARIVVRIRYALANNLYDLAHPDIPSGSPYGKGSWADEWFYIYPDSTHVRHMRIYTGLAPVSLPFGFDRVPPKVVHEFMESVVRGLPGHKPTDDIDIKALTLIRLFGSHSETVIPEGISTKISYKPYPEGFAEFRDASIMLINLKAQYKPFTIGMPYGVRVQPYKPEGELPHVFQTWGYSPQRGYTAALGHMLNYWHYRRTDNTLEQVYLHGMTNAADPVKELAALAWSWVAAPRLQMDGLKRDYMKFIYDPAQKAYIVPRKGRGPTALEFALEADDDDDRGAPFWIINPAFIVKDWDKPGIELKVDGQPIKQGKAFRVGYEQTPTGKDLVIWLKMKTNKTVTFSIAPQ
jgi:hypothetical protein